MARRSVYARESSCRDGETREDGNRIEIVESRKQRVGLKAELPLEPRAKK